MTTQEKESIRIDIKRDLAQMNGTEYWYKTILPGLTYTDGVKMMAERCGAYWLIDYIVSYQLYPSIAGMDMQVWKIKVVDESATIELYDCNRLHDTFKIGYSDFPLDEFEIHVMNKVIYLPSEE